MFNRAVDDDLIVYNPFDRLSGGLPAIEKDWHYVNLAELDKLLQACPNQGWKVFLGLCRLAGLRQGEALALQWGDVDWQNGWLTVWAQKTKRRRVVPIAPELLPVLRDAFEQAPEGEPSVVRDITPQNVWRDFGVIRKRAGVRKYAKWCHTLRKNRESDWIAAGFPFHVVVEWMGHSDEVARHHYLRVNESDLRAATTAPIPEKLTQLLTQLDVSEASAEEEHDPQVLKLNDFRKKAGDGIRTHDVQLGKSLVGAQSHILQWVIPRFWG
jgi:integrase